MSESENVELVKAAYAAFDRGDLAGLLEMLAPDIEWNWPAVRDIPHSGPCRGRDAVARVFEIFSTVDEPIAYDRHEFIAQGDRVVVLSTYRARAKSSGRTFETDVIQAWTVRNGQIARFDIQYNTVAAVEAYRVAPATDHAAIASRRGEFVDAFNAADVQRMAALLTDDHIGMPPNRPALRGARASIEFWREGMAAATSRFTVLPQDLTVDGDVAVDRFDWAIDSTPRGGGAPIRDEGKCVWIWRRESDGAWKVASAVWNSDLATAGLWSGAGVPR
ncbi:MAG TPA: nuclear transport factor 2 family protein [Vicinamibacterales bacterium]|jgi:ketosteroid isomerase-like protein|nr:nuclear transport factor 2 family protein [Vicinamibacterales bacterium]